MDQKLLEALSNMSLALEEIADALKDSGKGGNKSATTDALQGGDFVKQIKEINVGVKQLQIDSKKILKNQETIIALSKKSASKKSPFEEAGGDKKKESQMKKGIGTILLIAVAVLAIGMAFKLVGKIDFLSVVGLGLAMLLISEAFKKVALLNIDLKQAGIASITMVMMAIAVTMSSWILKLIAPIGIAQLFTGIAITAMFHVMTPKFAQLLEIVSNKLVRIGYGSIIKATSILVAMSIAITLSSWVLRLVTPLSIGQIITGIGITAMFYVVSNFLPKLALAIVAVSKIMSKKDLALMPILLVGFATAITLSSWVLKFIRPMSFGQIITGIAITAMFWVVSNFLPKLALAIIAVSKIMSKKDLALLPLMLVAFSVAIMLSSLILKMIKPLSFGQIITTIVVTAVFWAVSYFLPDLALGVIMVDKILGRNKIWMIPLVFVAISAAIMVSSLLFAKTPELGWKQMVGILLIGLIFAGLSYVMPEMAAGLVLMDKALGKGKMFLIPLVYLAIATAIMLSSHILDKSVEMPWMKLLNILIFSVVLVIAVVLVGLISLFLVKVVGVSNTIKGTIAIVAIAGAIMLSSIILSKGKYNKYPSWRWTLFSGISIAAFGVIGWLLMKLGGISTYIKGGIAILAVSATIMAASHILAAGNYSKYPKLSWAIGVAASLAAFGVAAALLGPMVFGPQALVFLAGSAAVLGVAATVMAASHILAAGNYSKYPSLGWSASVALSLAAFTTGMVLLGGMIVASFGLGALALKAGSDAVLGVAKTIVKASFILAKGKWKKGPTTEWASGVAIALGAFAPVYKMLMNNAPGLFSKGGGLGPDDFAKGIVTVTKGILTAANEFASPKNKGVWKKAPTKEWATGVGIAIGAFAPVYKMMLANAGAKFFGSGGIGPEDFAKAILTVTRGIITAAKEFAKNTAPFKEGMYPSKKWGEGVGAALKAFSPVFKMLNEDKGWFTGGDEAIRDMVQGILSITTAIIKVGYKFAKSGLDWTKWPKSEWGAGVASSIMKFKYLGDEIGTDIPTTNGVLSIVGVMVPVAKTISENSAYFEKAVISPTFADKLSHNIVKFSRIMNYVNNKLGGSPSVFPILAVASAMVRVAKRFSSYTRGWFYAVRDVKEVDEWAYQLKWTTRKFVNLLNWTNKHASGVANFSMIEKIATHMTKVAEIIAKGQRSFNTKVNPGFMQSLYKNFIYYIEMVKKLKKEQGGIGSAIGRAITGDPVINMAKGMLTLAHAYDRLAGSLTKMGKAMALFNDKKISQLERITKIRPYYGNPARLAALGGVLSNSISNALSVSSSMPAVQTSTKTNQEKKGDIFPKGKYGNIAKQQDMIIELLQLLNDKLNVGSNIDSATIKYLTEKKSAKM